MRSLPPRHMVSWAVFIALLLLATIFVAGTPSELPPDVASHFDALGRPIAFMSRGGYVRFVCGLSIGLPLLIVALLRTAYRRATVIKLPNRDYWLAPQRLEQTRAFLVAHGVWFGSLLVSFGCAIHWLEVKANRLRPAHLSNRDLIAIVAVFLLATAVWTGVLLFAFRRPAGR